MNDRYVPVAERCEHQASVLKDEGRDEAATVLWEADALIRALEIENGRLRHAVVIADLQIGDGHIEASRETLHAALDGKDDIAIAVNRETKRERIADTIRPILYRLDGGGEAIIEEVADAIVAITSMEIK